MSDEAFGEALEQMARDVHQDVHPTLAVHQLFSGHATRQGKAPEDLAGREQLATGNHLGRANSRRAAKGGGGGGR